MKKRLTTFDLSMVVVSLILGMGIFRTPASVARDAGSPGIFFAAWIFGAFIALLGALTFAEIGSRFPRTGGSYKILAEAYHPAFAFMVNWIQVISNAASIGGIALVGSGYLPALLGLPHMPYMFQELSAIALIIVLFIIGAAGLKISAGTQNVLSLVKIIMVLALCAGVFFVKGKPEPDILPHGLTGAAAMHAFTICLLGVFFTYEGYQWVINFGGETEAPSKTLPRAVLSGISIILVLYLSLNYAFYRLIGFNALAASLSPASVVAGLEFGKWGVVVSSSLIFISIAGYSHAGMMSNPRMYTAMAEDGVLPKVFLKYNSATGVRVPVLILFTFFILVSLVFASTFEKLLEYIILFDNIGLAAAAASIFILRSRNTSDLKGQLFKLRLYPLVPIVFLAALLLVTIGIAIRNWHTAVYGLFIFLIGWPIYYLLKRWNSSHEI